MKDEIYRDMVLMGCKSIKELDSTKLIYRKYKPSYRKDRKNT